MRIPMILGFYCPECDSAVDSGIACDCGNKALYPLSRIFGTLGEQREKEMKIRFLDR